MAPCFQMQNLISQGIWESSSAICRAIHDVWLASTLEVVEVLAEEVDLKDKVDVIVSEWMLGFPGFFRGPGWFGGLGEGWWCSQIRSSRHRKVVQTLLYLDRRRIFKQPI